MVDALDALLFCSTAETTAGLEEKARVYARLAIHPWLGSWRYWLHGDRGCCLL